MCPRRGAVSFGVERAFREVEGRHGPRRARNDKASVNFLKPQLPNVVASGGQNDSREVFFDDVEKKRVTLIEEHAHREGLVVGLHVLFFS